MKRFIGLVAVAMLIGCNDGPLTGGGAGAGDFPGDGEQSPDNTPPPEGDGNCYTQGYWKNHEEVWPVTDLTLGSTSYDQAALLDLFATEPEGDASIILGHQLIAALLNVENGAATTTEVAAALDDSQLWMTDYADADALLPYGIYTSPVRAPAIDLGVILDEFNNGLAGDCGEDDGGDGGGGDTDPGPQGDL